jgi:hypothetical protein
MWNVRLPRSVRAQPSIRLTLFATVHRPITPHCLSSHPFTSSRSHTASRPASAQFPLPAPGA